MVVRGASRGARRGYLAPGDPTPPPTAPTDYLDYRGVATWRETSNLEGCAFGLGAFMDLRRGRPRGPIGLPGEVLNRHAVVIGPAGSGKTVGVLLPWIHAAMSLGWSVVALDVKGDLRESFLAYKDRHGSIPGGRLIRWDFLAPRNTISWNWLAELTDDSRVDAAVTAVLGRPTERSAVDPYFYQRDCRTLRGLLLFGRTTIPACSARDLIGLLQDQAGLERAVASHPRAPGAGELSEAAQFDPLDYPKVVSGVVTALAPMATAEVDAVTRTAELNLDAALDDHNLLVVGARLSGGERSATLSSLLVNQLRQRLYERFAQGRRPVLLVLDEAAQIARRVDIAELMEVARSAGVGVVVAIQDAAKLRDENDRSSILSNASAFAVLPGASPLSVEAFSRRLAERPERTYSVTTGGGDRQQTLGTESVPVLREREIMQNPFGQRPAVVQVNARELGITTKPLLVDLYRPEDE